MSQSSYKEQVFHPCKDFKIQELFEKIYTKMEELASPTNILYISIINNKVDIFWKP